MIFLKKIMMRILFFSLTLFKQKYTAIYHTVVVTVLAEKFPGWSDSIRELLKETVKQSFKI
jgi:hypothetical protein